MVCNAIFLACVLQGREGHEFPSCRSEFFNDDGFSRCGKGGAPQGLKPLSVSSSSARLEVVPFPCVHPPNLKLGYRTLPAWSRG